MEENCQMGIELVLNKKLAPYCRKNFGENVVLFFCYQRQSFQQVNEKTHVVMKKPLSPERRMKFAGVKQKKSYSL